MPAFAVPDTALKPSLALPDALYYPASEVATVGMATLIDLLRHLGTDLAPGGGNAFRGPLHVPADPVAPVSVPLSPSLTSAWSRITGRTTGAHHALALAAARTAAPIVLQGAGSTPDDDLLLLVLAHLTLSPNSAALWLVPDASAAALVGRRMEQLAPLIDVSWASTADGRTPRMPVQLVIARFDDLHQRLLRFADRAWRWFWPRLDLVAIPAAEHAVRDLSSHLPWLVRRAERLARVPLRFFAAAPAVVAAGPLFRETFGAEPRVIPVPSGLAESALVGLWREQNRAEAALRIASALRKHRVSVTVVVPDQHDMHFLSPLETQMPGLRVGLPSSMARVAVVWNIPPAATDRAMLARRGYRLLLFLAGDDPHELFFAANVEHLLAPVPALANPRNPYVVGRHLQCAAGELPLLDKEIQRWGIADQLEPMARKQLLRDTGGGQWRPGEAARECDFRLGPSPLGEPPVEVFDRYGEHVARISRPVAERLGVPGATWWPAGVVASSSDEPARIDIAAEEQERVALPLLSVRVEIMDVTAARTIQIGEASVEVACAKVRIRQRVVGLKEYRPGAEPVVMRLREMRERTWTARAFRLALSNAPGDPSSAGWSIAATLPSQLHLGPDALLVTYDLPSGSTWVVETEAAGTGVADYVFEHAERLLGAVALFVHEAVHSGRFERLAALERSWLDAPSIPASASVSAPSPPAAEVPRIVATPEQIVERAVPERVVAGPLPAPPLARRTKVYAAVPVVTSPAVHAPEAVASLDPRPVGEREGRRDEETERRPDRVVEPRPLVGTENGLESVAPESAVRKEPPRPTPPAAGALGPDAVGDLDVENDVTWMPRTLDELVEEIVWAPGVDEPAVEEISWEAEQTPANRAAGNAETGSPREQDIPPLGRESSVPLNTRRPTARYPGARGERPQRFSPPPPPVPASPGSGGDTPSGRSKAGSDESPSQPEHRRPARPSPPAAPRTGSRERAREEPRPPTGAEERGDVGAMIARMRRLREEREREKARPPGHAGSNASMEPAMELRFHPGQQVRCVPYGRGVVREARIVEGREHLTIEFADGSTALVDPVINVVRVLDEPDADQDEDR